MIRINGHLGAMLLSAFPAMAWKRQGPEILWGVRQNAVTPAPEAPLWCGARPSP
jgi:hypothetical protein